MNNHDIVAAYASILRRLSIEDRCLLLWGINAANAADAVINGQSTLAALHVAAADTLKDVLQERSDAILRDRWNKRDAEDWR